MDLPFLLVWWLGFRLCFDGLPKPSLFVCQILQNNHPNQSAYRSTFFFCHFSQDFHNLGRKEYICSFTVGFWSR